MQKVSKAYQDSMKSSLRERAYIMLSFGLVNQEAQAKARVAEGDYAYYSRADSVFGKKANTIVYATLEQDFTKVDGSMFFLPRPTSSEIIFDTGIVSQPLLSESNFDVVTNLNMAATMFKGLTVDFGENYPLDFDIISDGGQIFECRNNTESVFSTEQVIENTTLLTIRVYRMKTPLTRLRVTSIYFGYGLSYYNQDVISSSLESYISPIGEDIPQIDFTVTLDNYDQYFNIDNPKSAINYLETGQELEINYGYQLPNGDEIEWVKGNSLLCSDWEADDNTVTIRAQDVFRNMDSEYHRGIYKSDGVSYYELAEGVLQDAGCVDYYIDPQLKNLYTKNPLPRVKHKEALQIIANACRCALFQTRDGAIQIKSSFVPEAEARANTEAAYSHAANIMNDGVKDEYGSLATNYATVNGAMFFLPRNISGKVLNTGFVSEELSGDSGEFSKNPVITIKQEVACMYYGVKLVFGQTLPAAFTIRTYNNGEPVTVYEAGSDTIQRTTVIHAAFNEFDTMTIEFTKTAEPYNRIVLNNFSFGDITSFTMTRNDMVSSPKALKQELIREVVVPCYSYQPGVMEESLVSEEISVTTGDIETFYVGEPSYDFRAILEGVLDGVTVLEWGNYYVKVQFNATGTFHLEIFGYRYNVVERYAVNSINSRGKTVKWENPLMSDMAMASDLAQWLGDYYASGIEYEYNTRGNPELDVNDIIYQENEFYEGMKVRVYRQTLGFNQSFSGKVTARRIGG